MTRDEILNMPAGTKMNQLIWWKVFDMYPTPPNNDMKLLPDYSTDISAAWEVVDKLVRFSITIESFPKGVLCRFFGAGSSTAGDAVGWADTAPLAICRAALLAVEAAQC